jgi:putative peptidoglycan lipid II flippase
MLGRLLSVGGYTALSRVAGFLRDIMLAAVLGAGAISDAFFVAFRLPNHFRAIFAEGAFTAAFLPRYSAARTKEGPNAAAEFASEVFAWQVAVNLGLLLVALAGMRYVVMVLAPGFADNPAQMELAINLTRITFPYLICISIVVVLSDMLNTIQRFKAAAAAPILLNVSMIAALALAPWFPNAAYAAAYGVLAAGFLELGFLVWMSAKSGLYLRLTWPRWSKRMGEFVRALGAALVGAGSVQIGLFVDTLIASFLPSGDLTALYFADRINQLPMGIVGVALGIVLLPEMAARISAGDDRAASVAQNRAVGLGLLLSLPCLAAFLIMPDLIMRALFAHGAFHVQDAHDSARALMAYGVGMPAFVLMRCVVPSFYARHDTATPVRATIAAVIANIAMKFVFVWGLDGGIVGIALATSFAAWLNLGLLIAMARSRKLLVMTTELKRSLLSIGAAVFAAAAGFYGGTRIVQDVTGIQLRDEITFVIAALAGAGAYTAMVVALRRDLPLGSASR